MDIYTCKDEAPEKQEKDEQQGIKTRTMVRRKEEEELKKKHEGKMTREKIKALEKEIKRINQAREETSEKARREGQ